MKAKDLAKWIDDLTDDIEFEYKGIHGSICPFNRSNISLVYGDQERTCGSVEEAMNTTLFEGKSLNEISEDLEL